MTPPVLGAAILVADIPAFRDWLFERDRDVEIRDFYHTEVTSGDWRGRAEAARDELAGHRGRVGIHGPFWNIPLDAWDPDVRKLTEARLMTGLEICGIVGADQMVVHSPVTTWDDFNKHNYPDAEGSQLARVAATISTVLSRAEDQGVTLVLENVEDRVPETRRRLVEGLGSPALKLSVDTGHAYYAHVATGGPPVDFFIADAGPLLEHVHLQDADGYADRHWQIGHGSILWPGVFDAIAASNSNARLIIELRDHARIPASVAYLEAAGLGQ